MAEHPTGTSHDPEDGDAYRIVPAAHIIEVEDKGASSGIITGNGNNELHSEASQIGRDDKGILFPPVNMRLAIGAPERIIIQISLSDDLNVTSHIDIRLVRSNRLGGRPTVQATTPGPGDTDQPSEHLPAAAGGTTAALAAAGVAEQGHAPAEKVAKPVQEPAANGGMAAQGQVAAPGGQEQQVAAPPAQGRAVATDKMSGWLMTVATLLLALCGARVWI
ncbi:hypothetical protein HU200_020573 [Digitaria exilis]|uniref:Uncharacterized protein n=1 Tax=Digitaria exilis TaxID=1010633 RepID=A0A835F2C9_9POAL|nr:hypothetical protein HU200_020573 [Digitaria exilis]